MSSDKASAYGYGSFIGAGVAANCGDVDENQIAFKKSLAWQVEQLQKERDDLKAQVDDLKDYADIADRVVTENLNLKDRVDALKRANNELADAKVRCDEEAFKHIVMQSRMIAEKDAKLREAHGDIAVLIDESKELLDQAYLGELVQKMKPGTGIELKRDGYLRSGFLSHSNGLCLMTKDVRRALEYIAE